MRRLPGPADCRLSEGDQIPEALYELFRDWQRTQTQSCVTALQGPRQQMDVWFCRAAGTDAERHTLHVEHPEVITCTLSRACPGHPCLRLTDDLHGGLIQLGRDVKAQPQRLWGQPVLTRRHGHSLSKCSEQFQNCRR